MTKIRKALALILLTAMLAAIIPQGIFAVNPEDMGWKFEYYVFTESADVHEAETDGKIKAKLYFYVQKASGLDKKGQNIEVEMNGKTKNRNALAQGVSEKTGFAPWNMSSVEIKNSHSDAYAVKNIFVSVKSYYNGELIRYTRICEPYYPGGKKGHKWIENGEKIKYNDGNAFGGNGSQARQPYTITDWDKFSGNYSIPVNSSPYSSDRVVVSMLPGTLGADKYDGSKQISFWETEGSPTLSFEAEGEMGVGGNVNWGAMLAYEVDNKKLATEVIGPNDNVVGFRIDKYLLASFMNKNQINKITVSSTLKFQWFNFSDKNLLKDKIGYNMGGDKFRRYMTFTREALEIKDVTFSNSVPVYEDNNTGWISRIDSYKGISTVDDLFVLAKDNSYFNSNARFIAAEVDLYWKNSYQGGESSDGLYSHVTEDVFEKGPVTGNVKLQIGDRDPVFLDSVYVYFSDGEWKTSDRGGPLGYQKALNGKMYYFFDLGGKQIDTGTAGLKLIFDNVRVGRYYLTQPQVDYTEKANEDKLGDAEFYDSTVKVDTITPTSKVTLTNTEDELELGKGWLDKGRLTYEFDESMEFNGESPNRLTNVLGQEIQYEFVDAATGRALAITRKNGEEGLVKPGETRATKVEAPAAAGMISDMNIGLLEEGEFEGSVRIIGRDKAGNWFPRDFEFAKFKLDNLAPRVKVYRKDSREIDMAKTVRIDFGVTEKSETGKVYYTFSKSATPPDIKDYNEKATVTEIHEDLYDQWAFVSQDKNSTISGENIKVTPVAKSYSVAENNSGIVYSGAKGNVSWPVYASDARPWAVDSLLPANYGETVIKAGVNSSVNLGNGVRYALMEGEELKVTEAAHRDGVWIKDGQIIAAPVNAQPAEGLTMQAAYIAAKYNMSSISIGLEGTRVGDYTGAIVATEEESTLSKLPEESSLEGDPVNGAAVLRIEKGESFNGYIHYYTEDKLGNKSEIMSEAINVDNPDAKIYIDAVNNNSGKPCNSFDIKITAEDGYKLQWQWLNGSGDAAVAGYRDYTDSKAVGNGVQSDDMGNEVVMKGECTLRVKATKNDVSEIIEKKFVFDNQMPEINIVAHDSGTYKATQSAHITVRDVAGVKKAAYSLLYSDGNVVDGWKLRQLSTPEQGETIEISGVKSGAYKLMVTASDMNGTEGSVVSNVLNIRVDPVITAVGVDTDKALNGVPLIDQTEYRLNVDAAEPFMGAEMGQNLYYRVSNNKSEWGQWVNAGPADKDLGLAHRFVGTIKAPIALEQGENTIYMQTIISASGADPMYFDSDLICSNSLTVIYDTEAPSYNLNLQDRATNTPFKGELRVMDTGSGIASVVVGENIKNQISLEEIENGFYAVTVSGNCDGSITVTDNVGHSADIPVSVKGFDFEGPTYTNTAPQMIAQGDRQDAEVEISIADVQRGTESFAIIPAEDINSAVDGAGKIDEKYFISATVQDILDENGKPVIDEDGNVVGDPVGEIPEIVFGNMAYEPFRAEIISERLTDRVGESDIVYKASIKGVNGSYFIGVRASDSLGNSRDYVVDMPLTTTDTQMEIKDGGITVSPRDTYDKTNAAISFNVPVYVLPQKLIMQDDEEGNLIQTERLAANYLQTHHLEIKKSDFKADGTAEYTLYCADELGRTRKLSVTLTQGTDINFMELSEPIVSAQTYVTRCYNGEEGYVPYEIDGISENRRLISGDDLAAPYANYLSENENEIDYTVIEVQAPDGYMLMPAEKMLYPAPGMVYAENEQAGISLWADLCNNKFAINGVIPNGSPVYGLPEGAAEELDINRGYSRLVYNTDMVEEGYTAVDRNYREFKVLMKPINDLNGEWTEYMVSTVNIDNTPPQAAMKLSPGTNYQLSDEGFPIAPINYTVGPVLGDVVISDPHTGLHSFDLFVYREDQRIIDLTNIELSSIEFPYVIESAEMIGEDEARKPVFRMVIDGTHEDLNIISADLKIRDNVRIGFNVYNGVGNFGMLDNREVIDIDYINYKPISADDYSLTYEYLDYNGIWQSVGDANNTYFKKARAVLVPTQSGTDRGLRATNVVADEQGRYVYELNRFANRITYTITDNTGEIYEVAAELTKGFDETSGQISYSYDGITETKNPIPITITVKDSESGIGEVTLRRIKAEGETFEDDLPPEQQMQKVLPNGNPFPADEGENREGAIKLTRDCDGTSGHNECVYTGYIENGGSHIITLKDKVGNIAEKSFMVTNIDAMRPTVTGIIYSTPKGEITSGTVFAEVLFSEPGVRLTEIEVNAPLTADDISADGNNSVIRFKKSGTVAITFADLSGNIGYDNVAVDQIIDEPPVLEAVTQLDDTMTKVSVTFTKKQIEKEEGKWEMLDPLRALNDITVSYGGIAKRVQETKVIYDEEGHPIGTQDVSAEYVFTENGDYTFDVYADDGGYSKLTVKVEGIDKRAPKITQITWSYEYGELDASGVWQGGKQYQGKMTDIRGKSASIGTDYNPVTNNDVKVTVKTDLPTKVMGDYVLSDEASNEGSTDHTLNYDDNGMYIFNLKRPNGLYDFYGFEVGVIDKTPPVLNVRAPELLFYENPDANAQPYSKELLTSASENAFEAYDEFGGRKDLNDRVKITFSEGFYPETDDFFKKNVFDRTKTHTATYEVMDDAGNITRQEVLIRLIGRKDTVVTVNDRLPDYAGRIEVSDGQVTLRLENYSHQLSFAKVATGTLTMGQMKSRGVALLEETPGSGIYKYNAPNGWSTFMVQTDTRDYFIIQVYVTY